MHQRILPWLCAVCVFFTAVVVRAQTPAPKVTGGAELILVAKVTGTVTMTVAGKTTQLAANASVLQSAKINTAKNSSVVLVFSNGATTNLGADTELVIEEFLQDPFSSTIKMADITDEPSVSTTKLKLNHGELVGKVAHLKHDKGSTFVVETPVGAAGIRGTTFQIVFRPDPITGLTTFQLRTVEGNVALNQPTAVNASGTVSNVAVPAGQQVTVDVNVTTNAAGQTVITVVNPAATTGTVPITAAVAAQVNQVATEISAAVQQTVITSTPPTTSASGVTTTTTTASIDSGSGTPTTTSTTTTTTTNGSSKTTSSTTTAANGTTTTTTSSTTTGTDGSKTTKIVAPDFTGTVTTPPARVTTGDGKSG